MKEEKVEERLRETNTSGDDVCTWWMDVLCLNLPTSSTSQQSSYLELHGPWNDDEMRMDVLKACLARGSGDSSTCIYGPIGGDPFFGPLPSQTTSIS
jgi:hypothetical protein